MIITAGLNVYPREIEEVLRQHPGVRQAGVVGVKHPIRGETIVAYVVPEHPGSGPQPAPRRHPRVPPRAPAELQGAAAHRTGRRDPDHAHREAPAPRAPRPSSPGRWGRRRGIGGRHHHLATAPFRFRSPNRREQRPLLVSFRQWQPVVRHRRSRTYRPPDPRRRSLSRRGRRGGHKGTRWPRDQNGSWGSLIGGRPGS